MMPNVHVYMAQLLFYCYTTHTLTHTHTAHTTLCTQSHMHSHTCTHTQSHMHIVTCTQSNMHTHKVTCHMYTHNLYVLHNQESPDALLLEVAVSLLPIAWLHLKVIPYKLECCFRYVHAAVCKCVHVCVHVHVCMC